MTVHLYIVKGRGWADCRSDCPGRRMIRPGRRVVVCAESQLSSWAWSAFLDSMWMCISCRAGTSLRLIHQGCRGIPWGQGNKFSLTPSRPPKFPKSETLLWDSAESMPTPLHHCVGSCSGLGYNNSKWIMPDVLPHNTFILMHVHWEYVLLTAALEPEKGVKLVKNGTCSGHVSTIFLKNESLKDQRRYSDLFQASTKN